MKETFAGQGKSQNTGKIKKITYVVLYTANIYSHIVTWIYQSYGENVYIDDRQTFL